MTLEGHTGPIIDCRFEEQSAKYVVSSSRDHTLRVWDVRKRSKVSLRGAPHSLLSRAY